MATEKQYYMTRGKLGEECIYKSPAELLKKGYAYFDWCSNNLWCKKDMLKSGEKKGELVDLPLGRPFTMIGLCVFCGLSEKTFAQLENDSIFVSVTNHLRAIVAQHQLEGAILGVYNVNAVARLQGLTDKHELTNADGEILIVNVTSDQVHDQLDILVNHLLIDR